MEPDKDAAARLQAQMDQAIASMADVAKALRVLYVHLTEEGFDNRQALKLCNGWMAAMLNAGRDSGDEDE